MSSELAMLSSETVGYLSLGELANGLTLTSPVIHNFLPSEATDIAAQLLPDPYGDGASGGGRWYPGALTLGNGDVLTLFGHVREDDSRHRNANPERFNASSNNWYLMPKLAIDSPIHQPDKGSPIVRPLFVSRTFQLPDGRLFFATAMPAEWETYTDNPNRTDGPHFSTFYDVVNGTYTGPLFSEPTGYDNWRFPCVLLPLLPEDDYHPRVMHCGRAEAMLVLYYFPPDRSALFGGGGGVESQEPDNGQLIPAEIYDPDIDWVAGQYRPGLGNWTVETGMPTQSRNYHSAALLLPNGSILTSGGNANAQSGDPDTVGVKRIELYDPPYPTGTRLQIFNCPAKVTYNEEFEVEVSAAAEVQRIALIRMVHAPMPLTSINVTSASHS
ncbi:hypothetical protein N7532_006672 [Penicillium argentinense]|uniref:Uncharacterized protein n=1 Tax=Penicillium argentinense TaxID=1131581 RepID=A0A9W9FGD8_9EURO|nr:uncharacterized protein N7532_006672 [Penicillium argentinense]KAJ5099671.1 hypothetical protein N7532_006672 [Penicillium argentinense]